MTLATLLVFSLVALIAIITPGPTVLLALANGSRHGVRRALPGMLGAVLSDFVLVGAVALGLGALLAASEFWFSVVKWAGAAYLVWLGIGLLRSRPAGGQPGGAANPAHQLRRQFAQGFLTNALNPKVALFFLAFVPQFIAPDAPDKALAFLLLGLIFNINSLPINLGYAWIAAWAARRLHAVQRTLHWLDRAAGVLFVGFGLRLALTDNPQP